MRWSICQMPRVTSLASIFSVIVPGKAISRAAGMVLVNGSGCGAVRGTAAAVEDATVEASSSAARPKCGYDMMMKSPL